jgi:hypothetical protein
MWKNLRFFKHRSVIVFEKFGQKVRAAHREVKNTQNCQIRDNESQLLIMMGKFITSYTVK